MSYSRDVSLFRPCAEARSSTRLRVLATASLLMCLAACGGGGSKKLDGGPAPVGDGGVPGDGGVASDAGMPMKPVLTAPAGQVALRVDQARRALIGGSISNLEVAFTIANGAGSPPASVSQALFQVKTMDGLYVMATPGSFGWVEGVSCDPTISVGAGVSYACVMTFDLSSSAAPVELSYRTANLIAGVGADQRMASAPLVLEACTQCDAQTCTYLDKDPDNCGMCGKPVELYDVNGPLTNGARCLHGKPACPVDQMDTICPAKKSAPGTDAGFEVVQLCADLQTNKNHCGSCTTTVDTGDCVNSVPTCSPNTPTMNCGSDFCVDLTRNAQHCGACDHNCNDLPANARGSNWLNGSEDRQCQQNEAMQTVCRRMISLSTSQGDTVHEADTCVSACKANGYTGCAVNCNTTAQTNDLEDGGVVVGIFGCGCSW
jgi:hypothetical protein